MTPQGMYVQKNVRPFLAVVCPACGAGQGRPCVSKKGNDTYPHRARIAKSRKGVGSGGTGVSPLKTGTG
jgi:hypothetical protein